MKKIILFFSMVSLVILMANELSGQIVIRDSVTISPKNVKSDLNTIQTLDDCEIGTPRQLVLFTIFPGTVTITTLASEYSPPGLTLGPMYISNARFVGQGDTITVFNSIGGSWTKEFTQIRQATIWLVLGPEGTPDSGPTNKFQVLGTYPIDFDFFMCGHPEDDDSDLFLKFANFNYKHVPFPVDYFTIRPNNTAISPGDFTHFFIQGMDRYDNRINGRVADTTFVNVSLDANSARFGGLTLNDPEGDPEEGPVPEPVTSDKLENIRAGTVVYFVANGEVPSLAQTITITMTKTNDSNITGTGTLTVTGLLDHFQVTLQPDTIAPSETATITVQAKDNGNNNISIPNATPLKFALDTNGELLGNFIAPNGSQAKSLAGISYGDASAGNVKYVANGQSPSQEEQVVVTVSKSDEASKSGSGSVVVKQGLDHFAVTVAPDTIANTATATVTAQAKDKNDNDITISDATLLDFALDANGELLGNLIALDGSQAKSLVGIAYGDASAGKVKYIANGDLPDSTQQVMITVSNSDDATINGTGSVVVLEVSVEILNAALAVTDHVQVARWDNAYDAIGLPRNNISPTDNFIDLDPEKFFVRVTDPSKNLDAGVAEEITAKIGTLFASGANDDVPTEITLFETGTNTGVFDSKSQLLMSVDLPDVHQFDQDDGYMAHDGIRAGFSGEVEDEAKNDRTHHATLDGSVKAEYELSDGTKIPATVDVCQRKPDDERKTCEIRIWVFNEPFEDRGFDHDNDPDTPPYGKGNGVFDFTDLNSNGRHDIGEPSEKYRDISSGAKKFGRGDDPETKDGRGGVVSDAHVQSQIQRANIAWQQACIRIVQVGPTMFVDAPKNTKGNDILEDGEFDIHDDAETVYDSYKAGMIIDRVDIFFVADFPKKELANAIQYRVGYQPFSHDDHAFIFIVPNLDIRFRTLAHEIGHVLADQADSDNPLYIFFPQTRPAEPDDRVYRRRRITLDTAETCRGS